MKYFCFIVLFGTLLASFTGCGTCPSCQHKEEVATFKKRSINPWTWQDNRGFVQANEVTGGQRMLFTAGQVSVDKDGHLLHPGDMEKQIHQVMDNMETLLQQADFDLANVVRFTYYTTDVAAFTKVNVEKQVLMKRLKKAGCTPATSLIGVNALFHPDCLVEIEATVVD